MNYETERYIFTLDYSYIPPIDLTKVAEAVYEKRPTLRNTKILLVPCEKPSYRKDRKTELKAKKSFWK
jgi:hypothetical protein